MTSVQERLQIKREPLDKWSVRERLSLASAVARSGDQNWMSVSRSLKPFGDPNRPTDWFHQKNCAAQYGSLLEHVETPKRKKRTSSSESVVETPAENILRKLTRERLGEIDKLLCEEKHEYVKLQDDMNLLQSGNVSEEQLDKWCKEIDEEEKQKEEEASAHAQWLKEREMRKQEIERAWRPFLKGGVTPVAPRRKALETLDMLMDMEISEENEQQLQTPEAAKPALSPLLTSLLKSPSQVQNVSTSSILHSAITSHRPTSTTCNPTIASLLNSSTGVTVSPGLQHLVSSAIGQQPTLNTSMITEPITSDILEDAVDTLPHLKVEDIESTILSSDDPLPIIKNEEVEVIISDLIQNAHMVTNPEQHLNLDENGDMITGLDSDLAELCDAVDSGKSEVTSKDFHLKEESIEKELLKIDPFEFEEDPDIREPSQSSSSSITKLQEPHLIEKDIPISEDHSFDKMALLEEKDIKKEVIEEIKPKEKHEIYPGSVEIVEVIVMEDDDIDKELNTSQIQDIVHSHKTDVEQSAVPLDTDTSILEDPKTELTAEVQSCVYDDPDETIDWKIKPAEEVKKEVTLDVNETSHANTFTPDYSEAYFDDMAMEVNKLDKTGKAKRDYSRTKKKEEKDFDILLAVEKAVNAQLEDNEFSEEIFSGKEFQEIDKISEKAKVKSETDRSNSPWNEEEDSLHIRNKRRYSTPATPIDSVPNSPASSIANYDDDRDYRNWKKSVMLVYSRLATHKYASLFLKPINGADAPGYYSVVHRPMDLYTIRKNIDNGVIRTTTEFQRDVLLMFNNANMYNKTGTVVYERAKQMQQDCSEQIQILFQAQQGDIPPRRETRTSEPGNKRKRPPDECLRNKKRKED